MLSSQTVVCIDLDEMAYQILENESFVTVCAKISDGLLDRAVEVFLTKSDGSAIGMSVNARIMFLFLRTEYGPISKAKVRNKTPLSDDSQKKLTYTCIVIM